MSTQRISPMRSPLLICAAFLALLSLSLAMPVPGDTYTLNAGGPEITDIPAVADDLDYIKGNRGAVHTTKSEIYVAPGSNIAVLYSSERFTRENELVYRIPAPPRAVLTVQTMHAETYHTSAGMRKFAISINGAVKRSDLDVFAEANGVNKGIVLTFQNIRAVKGFVTISFTKSIENPQVNAIRLLGPGVAAAAKCQLPKTLPLPSPIPVAPVKTKCPLPSSKPMPSPSPIALPSMAPMPVDKPSKTKCPLPTTAATVAAAITPDQMPTAEAQPMLAAVPIPVSSAPTRTPAPAASSAPVVLTAPAAPKGAACSGDMLFCEDFENAPLGTTAPAGARWSLEGPASVSDTLSHGGRRALRLSPGSSEKAALVLRDFKPPGNSFFGRMNAYVERFPQKPEFAHWVMVEAAGGTERVRPIGGQLASISGPPYKTIWGIGADGGPTGDWTDWEHGVEAIDAKWACVEWELRNDGSTVNVWMDGKLAMTAAPGVPKTGFAFPQFDSVWFGWWVFQGNTDPKTFEVYLDNIALSSSRIGC